MQSRLAALSRLEHQILNSITLRIVPSVAELRGLDIAWKIDVMLVRVSRSMRQEFKLLLVVFEYGAYFLGPSLKRFTQMTAIEQDRYLESWAHSKLPFKRMGFQALKRSVLGAFYGTRRVWPRIGYGGPWLNQGYPHDYSGEKIVILHGH